MSLSKKDALASLQTPKKREKVNDAQIVTKLPKPVKLLVEEVAAKDGVSGSSVVREALGEYFYKRGHRG